MDRTITVIGVGEAAAAPDVVELNLGVRVVADAATIALREASRRAGDLAGALTAAGVAAADISTVNISVWPQYSERSTITGYEAANEVRVVFRDTARAGEVIDAAASVVGDAITINSLSFSIDDTEALESQARAAAMAAARRNADELAAAAGARVGAVVSIDQRPRRDGFPVPVGRAMMAQAAPAVPLAPGTQRVAAEVTVVYELTT